MIFDFTANPFGAATGQVLFLYEFAAIGAGTPPAAVAKEDRIMAGLANAVTIREVTVGGFN